MRSVGIKESPRGQVCARVRVPGSHPSLCPTREGDLGPGLSRFLAGLLASLGSRSEPLRVSEKTLQPPTLDAHLRSARPGRHLRTFPGPRGLPERGAVPPQLPASEPGLERLPGICEDSTGRRTAQGCTGSGLTHLGSARHPSPAPGAAHMPASRPRPLPRRLRPPPLPAPSAAPGPGGNRDRDTALSLLLFPLSGPGRGVSAPPPPPS